MRPVVEFRWNWSRRRAAGWLAAALLFLGAQFAVAFHEHRAEAPSTHRVGSCDLCVAHATPAAPPPAPLAPPAAPAVAIPLAAGDCPIAVARAGRTPHSPRAPPSFHPD